MKILTLHLKDEWYRMIENLVKTEEYRDYTMYWQKRLEGKNFDAVKFYYGYTHRSMTFKLESIRVSSGKGEWGAEPGKVYYIIKLGRRIE